MAEKEGKWKMLWSRERTKTGGPFKRPRIRKWSFIEAKQ